MDLKLDAVSRVWRGWAWHEGLRARWVYVELNLQPPSNTPSNIRAAARRIRGVYASVYGVAPADVSVDAVEVAASAESSPEWAAARPEMQRPLMRHQELARALLCVGAQPTCWADAPLIACDRVATEVLQDEIVRLRSAYPPERMSSGVPA